MNVSWKIMNKYTGMGTTGALYLRLC